MHLRDRVVGNTENVVHGTSDEVSQEDEMQQHSGKHEGADEQPEDEDEDNEENWQNWSPPAPKSDSAAQQIWNQNNSAGSRPVNLKPPRTDYYSESHVKYTENGWSYEVETYGEILRISTIPSDFFGNDPEWPSALSTAHRVYKTGEGPLERARLDIFDAIEAKPPNSALIYILRRNQYQSALNAARGRADFMKEWPSAFNHAENHYGHVHWASQLLEEARQCQKGGATRFEEAWPDGNPNAEGWLNELLDSHTVIGPRIFAMSPSQYIYLRKEVQKKKFQKREEVEDMRSENWHARAMVNPTIFRPNLPPLKSELGLPESSIANEDIYSLCKDPAKSLPDTNFIYLYSDRCLA